MVYDLDLLESNDTNLDNAEVWSYRSSVSTFNMISGVKHREDTVFGDVVIIVASQGYAGIVKYPEGEPVWEIDNCGWNPHSIEILPSGNVVCASSAGNSVRIYYTSRLLKGDMTGANEFAQYTLYDAHGVLWDPTEKVLWALGAYELIAYSVVKDSGSEKLEMISGKGGSLPTSWGHDLSADFFDTGYLFVTTGSAVYRFCKATGKFDSKFDNYAKVSRSNVKGFGNNLNGNYVFCIPNGGSGTIWEDQVIASWCTNAIYYAYWKSEYFLYVKHCVSESSAFYKVRIFCGQYQ